MLVLLLSAAIVILDQVTKHQVTVRFYLGESLPVIPGCFNLVHVRNTGAAWGMFGGYHFLLVGLSLAVLVVLIFYRRSFLTDSLVHRLSLGLMIGGIIGNLLDRIRLQYVVDFLDFHWQTHHFPAFNVADSAICVGVGLYMLSVLLAPKTQSPG
ncbi:MAG: signal peptidase II [bacterium]